MRADRSKLAATLLAYAYWPIAYLGVYWPLIVPRLDRWKSIPPRIVFVACLGFAAVLVAMGKRHTTKANLLHAVGIQGSLLLFFLLMARLHMPGFKKGDPGIGGGPLELLAGALLPIVLIFALAEGGRVLMPGKIRH